MLDRDNDQLFLLNQNVGKKKDNFNCDVTSHSVEKWGIFSQNENISWNQSIVRFNNPFENLGSAKFIKFPHCVQ